MIPHTERPIISKTANIPGYRRKKYWTGYKFETAGKAKPVWSWLSLVLVAIVFLLIARA